MSAELIPCDVAFIAGVEGYQVHEGGVQVLAAATAQELVEHGIALRKENPMAVRIDADIRFGEMDPGSRQALLAGITPSWAYDQGELFEAFEDLVNQAEGVWRACGVDRGLTIDGAPWSWFTPNGGDFQPVPSGPGEVLLSLWASWDGPSMTSGMFKTVGFRSWGSEAWIKSIQFGEDSAEITLGYGPLDDLVAVSELCSGFFEDNGLQICPGCDEADEWNIHLELGANLPLDFVGQQIGKLWWPCQEHREGSEVLLLPGIRGADWIWESGRWTRWDPLIDVEKS